jgi:hypothetical protein
MSITKPTSKTPKQKKHSSTPRFNPHLWHVHIGFTAAVLIIGAWVCLGILSGIFLLYAGKQIPGIVKIDARTIEIEMRGVSYDKGGSPPFNPGDGMEYLIVNISVQNHTNQVFNLAPVLQTRVTDQNGTVYTMAPAMLTQPLDAGPVNPGAERTGQLSYIVPDNSQKLVFHFDAASPQKVTAQFPVR